MVENFYSFLPPRGLAFVNGRTVFAWYLARFVSIVTRYEWFGRTAGRDVGGRLALVESRNVINLFMYALFLNIPFSHLFKK